MSLSKGYLRTSLIILNINRGLAHIGEFLVSLSMGYMLTSLVIPNIGRGLALLGVSGEFKNGEYATQSGYPQHRQGSGLPRRIW